MHVGMLGAGWERLVEPAVAAGAAKLWLVGFPPQGTVVEGYFLALKARLSAADVALERVSCDAEDLAVLVSELRRIVELERGREVVLNVSCGTRLFPIATMITVMLEAQSRLDCRDGKLSALYVKPERYEFKGDWSRSVGVGKKLVLPWFEAKKPPSTELESLKVLRQLEEESGNPVCGVDLLDWRRAIFTQGKLATTRKDSESARWMTFKRKVLDRLLKQQLIGCQYQPKSNRRRVYLTPAGRTILAMLAA